MKNKTISTLVVILIVSLILSLYLLYLQQPNEPIDLVSGKFESHKISANQVEFVLIELNTSAEEIKSPSFVVNEAEINGERIIPSSYSSKFNYSYNDINSNGILDIGDSITLTLKENVDISSIFVNFGLSGYWGQIPGYYPS